jgi:hypothetical protein
MKSSNTYTVTGDRIKVTFVSSAHPDKPMTYDVAPGEEFDGKGPDGSDVKVGIDCY